MQAKVVVHPRAGEVSGPVNGSEVRRLPFAAGHVALYWAGNPDAAVTVATQHRRRDLRAAGRRRAGRGRRPAGQRRHLRGRPGRRRRHVGQGHHRPAGGPAHRPRPGRRRVDRRARGRRPGTRPGPPCAQPPILSRSDWGADESLRFDAGGNEVWPPAFYPVQKLIVHHTAGANNDPNPAATIRSIYYYHAVTQGWGDIGYNFLVDEAGRIYKGRHSHPAGTTADTITGEDGGRQRRHRRPRLPVQLGHGRRGPPGHAHHPGRHAGGQDRPGGLPGLEGRRPRHRPLRLVALHQPGRRATRRSSPTSPATATSRPPSVPAAGSTPPCPQVRAQVAARMGVGRHHRPVHAGRPHRHRRQAQDHPGLDGVHRHRRQRPGRLRGLPVGQRRPAPSPSSPSRRPPPTPTAASRGARRYWYHVKAYDAAGNRSAASATVNAVAT